MGKENPPKPNGVDDEYLNAIQPVVDDRMRTDVLGPNFCKVLDFHTPASTKIVELITKGTTDDPNLKKAIKSVIGEFNKENKMRWFDRGLGIAGTVLLTMFIWWVQQTLKK